VKLAVELQQLKRQIMSEQHEEHPTVKQLRQHRGYAEDLTPEGVMKTEALRLSLLNPAERGQYLHHVDEELKKHEETINLRQRAQAHRYRSYVRAADQKLKLVGR
jgi:hypothetical protein